MKKPDSLYLIFGLLGALVLLFIVAPILGMVINTSSSDLFDTIRDEEVRDSIVLTLSVSFISTLIFAIAAVPFSYILAKKNIPGKKLILGIINIPVIIPHSAAGIAVLGLISRDTYLGKVGSFFGLEFVGSPIGIGLAMSFVSIPFLINSAVDGFHNVPSRLEHAAYNLGASSFRTFFKVSLPLAWRNVVSGFIMMFARGMSEFGAVVIVAYYPMITPVLIYERFTSFGLSYARPVAVIFIIITLIVFVVLKFLTVSKKN